MAEGRIKWYSHHLGHGFIMCEDPSGDVVPYRVVGVFYEVHIQHPA